jgi:prolyl oligopeptidase
MSIIIILQNTQLYSMKYLASALSLCLIYSAKAQYNYPSTKTVDSSDTYFGVTYKDPYRWLENLKSPEVEEWFKDQADYTNSIMSKISGRDALIKEWKELDKLQPAKYNGRVYKNGRYFYRKTMPGEVVGKMYYREGIAGKEVLLFDPTTFYAGKTLTLEHIAPSYDGKTLAFSYSEKGAEFATIRFMNVDTKTLYKDSIYPAAFDVVWTFDNKAIAYSWFRSTDNNDPSSRLNPKTKLHVLGADGSEDLDFFSNESYPELNIDQKMFPAISLSEDSKKYIFGAVRSVQNEFVLYYAPVAQAYKEKLRWKPLSTVEDKLVRSVIVKGDDVYAITHNNAKNYKLVHTSLKNPDWEHAETIAAEKKDQTLESADYSKDFILLVHTDGINSYVSKYNLRTKKTSPVRLPASGTVSVFCLDTKSNDWTIGITSWTKPYTEYSYNAETGAFSPDKFNKPLILPPAYNNLQVEEVEVKGHDGVMIPLSIIHDKGTKLNGQNIALVESYGAYGYSFTPFFSALRMSLATKGVVVAFPHVRGGSEKGEEWYRAGYKTTKPNTWKDFISCAEYLVRKGYTSPAKMSGAGTSAGGILISRAITARPDLFAAVICNVGCANAMRLEFSANGPINIPEFGSVKDSIECRALYEMDGMQHVVKGTKYPAVIGVGGWNDPRVESWQPGKFVAALQQASVSGRPVLMKINYDSGHFTEDKNVTFANFADQFAFVLWQCGHPDFQMKK